MAEVKNHPLNFGCGRPLCGLDLPVGESACAVVNAVRESLADAPRITALIRG
jgi:hypothetical protein